MSRPGTGLQALGIVGSKPPSRQGTAPPNTAPPASQGARLNTGAPRTGAGATTPAEVVERATGLLIAKMRARFGDAAADVKAQEIIAQEVMGFMKKGVSVREEDISTLETRIRARLTGSTPVTNTLAQDKRAQCEGDEWARIYEYAIAEGKELERAAREREAERRRRMREVLSGQMAEREAAKKAEHDEEMAYAAQEQAALRAWEAGEEARRRLQHDIALKLRQEREAQLAEKNARRAAALAKVRAEEEDMASRIAHETKAEFEREEAARVEAKAALRNFLLANEANKAVKAAEKERAAQEDAYYKEAWAAQLDKQDRERRERLSKNLARQAKTAEFAASLPEYKKWVDPALIERHWREANTRLDEQEAAKKKKAHDAALAMQATLQSQMVERDEAKAAHRREEDAKGQVVLARAREEEAREQAKRAAREAAKAKFRAQLDAQMRENVSRRRNQPISDVERSLNHELLSKVHEWKLTGRVNVSA